VSLEPARLAGCYGRWRSLPNTGNVPRWSPDPWPGAETALTGQIVLSLSFANGTHFLSPIEPFAERRGDRKISAERTNESQDGVQRRSRGYASHLHTASPYLFNVCRDAILYHNSLPLQTYDVISRGVLGQLKQTFEYGVDSAGAVHVT